MQSNACDSTQNTLCKLKKLTISRVFLVYHKGFVADKRNSEVNVAHCAFKIALSGAIMLTLLLVCSFSPKVQKCLLGSPEYRKSGASTLNDLLQATMLCIRAINRTIVGYVRCARFPQMQALASLFACGQHAGVRLQSNACDSTQNTLCKLKRLTIS